MKIVLLALWCVLVSVSGATADGDCRDGPKNLREHHTYRTLVHRLLDDEAVTGHVTPQMYAFLDSIIDQARLYLKPYPAEPTPEESESYGRRALPVIACILAANDVVQTDLETGIPLFSDALALTSDGRSSELHHYKDCDTGSYFYLAIAQVLGLPLTGVQVPRHMFVRWTTDKTHRFDFETTADEIMAPGEDGDIDGYYRTHFKLGVDTIGMRRELADLTDDEILSVHHVFVAQYLRAHEAKKARPSFSAMLKEFELAIRYDPNWAGPYNEIAWYHIAMRPRFEMQLTALRYALRAGRLSQQDAVRDTIACAWAGLGEFEKARRIEPDPDGPLDVTSDNADGRAAIRNDRDAMVHRRPCRDSIQSYIEPDEFYPPP